MILSCLQLIVSEMQVSNSDKICRKGHMCRVVSSQSSLGRIVWAWEGKFMFGLGPVFQSLYPEGAVPSGAGSSRVAFELDGGQCGNACEGG